MAKNKTIEKASVVEERPIGRDAVVLRTFQHWRPRVQQARLVREGDLRFIEDPESGAWWRAYVATPQSVFYVPVDPHAHDTPIAPGTEVEMPGGPHLAAPPPFDIPQARERLSQALDDRRRQFARLKVLLRSVREAEVAEIGRLAAGCPVTWTNSAGQVFGNDLTMQQYARDALEVVQLLRWAAAGLEADETLIAEVRAQLSALRTDLEAEKRRTGVAALPDFMIAGEDLVKARLSQYQIDLDSLDEDVDRLERARGEFRPALGILQPVAERFVKATTIVIRQILVQVWTQQRHQVGQSLRAIQEGGHPAEKQAAEALASLGLTAPTIAWPDDLLSPLVLVEN